jgi:ABC-type transport system involved in multi-copper enzyme maturation permease subunit
MFLKTEVWGKVQMNNFLTLVKMEFNRLWTRPKYIVFGIILVVFSALSLLPKLTGAMDSEFAAFIPSQASIAAQILSPVVTVAVLFFTFGIVANDIKNHWMRTVLTRPVKREMFIAAKVKAVLISLFIIMLFMTAIPLLIFNLTAPEPLEFDFFNVLGVFVFYFLHGALFTIVATWLSCFVPGIFNILIVAIWMFTEQILAQIVNFLLWDVKTALIFQDFFYPNGFAEGASIIATSGEFPLSEMYWGLAALALFTTLLFANINIIKIDKPSDD